MNLLLRYFLSSFIVGLVVLSCSPKSEYHSNKKEWDTISFPDPNEKKGPILSCELNGEVSKDTLILAVNNSEHFEKIFSELDKNSLIQWAKSKNIQFKKIDFSNSAPAEISTLPAIIFQNSNGRSIYKRRFKNLDDLDLMVSISKNLPQKSVVTRKSGYFWQTGKANIQLNLKVTDLSGGVIKSDIEMEKFKISTLESIKAGLVKVQKNTVNFSATDKSFYVDFNPWSNGSNFVIHIVIYSSNHCKIPVFEKKVYGDWNDKNKFLLSIGKKVEKGLKKSILTSGVGDSFLPIPNPISQICWEAFGLGIPKKKPSSKDLLSTVARGGYSLNPQVSKELNLNSILSFSFVNENSYKGIIKDFQSSANLSVVEEKLLFETSIKANGDSLVLNNDEEASNAAKSKIDTENHPISEYKISNINLPDQGIKYFEPLDSSGEVDFTLKGKKVKIKDSAISILPRLELSNNRLYSVLNFQSKFDLDIYKNFAIDSEVRDNQLEWNALVSLISDEIYPLTSNWQLDNKSDKNFLNFNFATTTGNYIGTIKDFSATFNALDLKDSNTYNLKVDVNTNSLEMGEVTEAAKSEEDGINVKKHPLSSLVLKSLKLNQKFRPGLKIAYHGTGDFTLMGKTVSVPIEGSISLHLILENGNYIPKIYFYSSFSLDINKEFGVVGPDPKNSIVKWNSLLILSNNN